MSDDGVVWAPPRCPECGYELDAEPLASQEGIKIAYTCPTHGAVTITDSFTTP